MTIMNSRDFTKVADKYYSRVLYQNISALVDLKFHGIKKVIDICSGPGLMSKILRDKGFHVTLVDLEEEFLNGAKKLCGKSCDYILADILDFDLSSIKAEAAVFTNASGYFTVDQIRKILSNAPDKLIANFFVDEDQAWAPRGPLFVKKRDNRFTYDIGPERLNLFTIKEKALHNTLNSLGYKFTWIYYHDFKTERLYYCYI